MEIRKIIRVGHSMSVTIPKSFGFKIGDHVVISHTADDNRIDITKIKEIH